MRYGENIDHPGGLQSLQNHLLQNHLLQNLQFKVTLPIEGGQRSCTHLVSKGIQRIGLMAKTDTALSTHIRI